MIKSRLILAIITLTTLALMAGACSKPGLAPLEDTTWRLESYGEPGNLKTVLEATQITATFDRSRKQVNGSAGCNSYFGDYQISDDKLTFLTIGHTEMYCLEPEGVMEQEQQYLKILQAAESFQVMEGKLQIKSGEQILIYTELNFGILQGNVTIGPITPVEKPGENPTVPPDVYEARKIMVYDENRESLVIQVDIDNQGNYKVELMPGTYTIDINRLGVDHSSEVPKVIKIESGKTIVLDIDIDTGIR